MSDLLQEFFQEIDRNLSQVSEDLNRWERALGEPEALNAVFRIVHNVKATCHVLGFRRIEALAHAAEDLLYAIREGSVAASPEAVSTVREAVARIEALVEGVRANKEEPAGEDNELLLVISCLAASAETQESAISGELTGFLVEDDGSRRQRDKGRRTTIFCPVWIRSLRLASSPRPKRCSPTCPTSLTVRPTPQTIKIRRSAPKSRP